MTASSFRFAALILAAGRSRRMGQPKLLLPWAGTSILGHLLAQWSRLGAEQVAVVCAADDPALAAELDRLGFPRTSRILNPAPDRGMFSSIQAAATWGDWSSQLTHFALILGDQPHLSPETLAQAIAFSAAHPQQVCQPARSGHGRHPVFLPRQVFGRLAQSPAAHLKEFLSTLPEPVARWESDDAGLDLDLDRPEDYQALRPSPPTAD